MRYVECICQVQFENGEPTHLIGAFQDITKEQNLIHKLELSVAKFSSIFSSTNDAISLLTRQRELL